METWKGPIRHSLDEQPAGWGVCVCVLLEKLSIWWIPLHFPADSQEIWSLVCLLKASCFNLNIWNTLSISSVGLFSDQKRGLEAGVPEYMSEKSKDKARDFQVRGDVLPCVDGAIENLWDFSLSLCCITFCVTYVQCDFPHV